MTLSFCSICDLSLDVERSPKAPWSNLDSVGGTFLGDGGTLRNRAGGSPLGHWKDTGCSSHQSVDLGEPSQAWPLPP